jgi:hypothetical protein
MGTATGSASNHTENGNCLLPACSCPTCGDYCPTCHEHAQPRGECSSLLTVSAVHEVGSKERCSASCLRAHVLHVETTVRRVMSTPSRGANAPLAHGVSRARSGQQRTVLRALR